MRTRSLFTSLLIVFHTSAAIAGEATLLKATARTKVGPGGSNNSIELYVTPQCADLRWNSKISFGDEPMGLLLSSAWNNSMPVRHITRLDRGVSWSIREGKKEYVEMPLDLFRDSLLQGAQPEPEMEGSEIQLRTLDLGIRPTGKSQAINGISAKEYQMTGLLVTEDPPNRRSLSLTLRGVAWVAPRSALSPKAIATVEAHRENARKWFPDAYASYLRAGDRTALSAAGFIAGAIGMPTFEKKSREFTRQLNSLPGFIIQSGAYWQETSKIKTEGKAESAKEASGAKAIGGLFSKVARGDYFGVATEAAKSNQKGSTIVDAPPGNMEDALIAMEIDTTALEWTQAPQSYCQIESDYVRQLPATHIKMVHEQKGPGKTKQAWALDQVARIDRARTEFDDEPKTEIVRLDKRGFLRWTSPSSKVEQLPLEAYRQARRQEMAAHAREAAGGKVLSTDRFDVQIEKTKDTKGIHGKKIPKYLVHLEAKQPGGMSIAQFNGAFYSSEDGIYTKQAEYYVRGYRTALGSPAGIDPSADLFSVYEALTSAGVADIASIDRTYSSLSKKTKELSIPDLVEGEWTLSSGERIAVKNEVRRLDLTYVADEKFEKPAPTESASKK